MMLNMGDNIITIVIKQVHLVQIENFKFILLRDYRLKGRAECTRYKKCIQKLDFFLAL